MKNNPGDMNNHIKLKSFQIRIDKDMVYHMLDCREDSPIYQEIEAEYQQLEAEAHELIDPVALLHYGLLEKQIGTTEYACDTPVCYVLISLGDKVTKRITEYFESCDYLAGMLLNAISDQYLFQLDDEVQKYIRSECAERQIGVTKRLEPPRDIPIQVQKNILDITGAAEELHMDVTEGYMFTTVKTSCSILVLSDNNMEFHAVHDCKGCEAVHCKLRKHKETNVKVIRGNTSYDIQCSVNENILEALIRQKVYVSAYCGGKGTCGKCRIKIVEGQLELTEKDKIKFTGDELSTGYRLACQAYPRQDCTIRLDSGEEENFDIVTSYLKDSESETSSLEENYGIAVDIGTTTIVIALVGLTSHKVAKTYSTVNKQRSYGADVITRIQNSNEGKMILLQDVVRKDLLEGFVAIVKEANITKDKIKRITIAGNTTMVHLLMGYSCKTLGAYPFTPVNIERIDKIFADIFLSSYLDIPVTILPGISTFVGADIVAGLAACNFELQIIPCLLIDLGTNGEMAIGNKEKILVTSTAAGPAFEGGNITCGVASIPGAIASIKIEESGIEYQTIGDKPPVGICGTGIIEMVSELLRTGLIDETGLLVEEYFDDGYEIVTKEDSNEECIQRIVFTQKDIREIQLAKAAIRAGIETLLHKYGVSYQEIGTVYLAGGFGYKLNIEKAVNIGLLPKELMNKIKAVGNSSLAGAVKELTDINSRKVSDSIIRVSKEINISGDKYFNEQYVNQMIFERNEC